MTLLGPLFRWNAVDALFSDRARIQSILDFEAALARAEVRAGVIPSSAASAIAAKCRADLFDLDALAKATAPAGNPAIPLVKQLTRLVEETDKEAGGYVHWGATSQDALDTGFVLQARAALILIQAELDKFCRLLAQLAEDHRNTPMAARTWMQQALPTTFGLRVAGWLDAMHRHRLRFESLRRTALVIQFGGAVGTLAALGNKGLDVAEALGEELHLAVPDMPWHAHRDRMADIAAALGMCTATLGKIARDISLQAQTEVAEVSEPSGEGRGGSSTLPHKRNSVGCAIALAAATRIPGLVSTMLSAMVQENERGLGGWQAEWETLPEIFSLSAGAFHHLAETVGGVEVDTGRMKVNLEISQGLIFAEAVQMALGAKIGRLQAHELLAEASLQSRNQKQPLKDILAKSSVVSKYLTREELNSLFDPTKYLGVADELVSRVLSTESTHLARTTERNR